VVVFVSLVWLSSCKKDNPGPSGETDVAINQYILDTMRKDYLWIDDIPEDRSLNLNQNPSSFFNSILSNQDRFSWIQNAEELHDEQQGIIKTSGMGVGVAWLNQSTGEVIASVRYVLEGSPAKQQGVKRGDLFVHVNGQRLMVNEEGDVPALNPINGNDPFTISLLKDQGDGTLVSDRDVTLTPVAGFNERAILVDTVWTLLSGKKVGYLFYNRFLDNQREDLIAAFGRLKAQGAEELVLDMRYNGGGGIRAAAMLSGLIHKDFDPDQLFIKYQYNRRYYDGEENYRPLLSSGGNFVNAVSTNNLGLQRVFILATYNSASASELVINNLKPFLGEANVIHIGATTYGKNVGSYTIDIDVLNDPEKVEWAIQPIIVKLANAADFGDYANGFTPSVDNRVNEWDYTPWKPLGSIEDPLVARALSIIEPDMQTVLSKAMSADKRRAPDGVLPQAVKGYEDVLSRPVPVWLDGVPLQRRMR